MPDLNDGDRAQIGAAVADAEARTSVELRLVLAQASSRYGSFALIYPALLALLTGGVASAVRPHLPAWMLFAGQAVVFLIGLGALQWWPLRIRLVPGAARRKAAWRHARLHYASLGLRHPHTRNMLLLFCSAAERSVEILADDAIAEKLPQAVWQPLIEGFKAEFSRGRTADAFVNAAHACADLLAADFPPIPGQANEIADELTEL